MNEDMELEIDLSGLDQRPMAPAVNVTEIAEAIRSIMKDADLEQLSRRMIRKQLEAQFQSDLSSYKDVINATILEVIEQQHVDEDEIENHPEQNEEDEDAENEQTERAPRKKAASSKKKATAKKRKRKTVEKSEKKAGGGFNAQLSLSPELAQVVGAETMARPQLVKALWGYIHEHNLQDPSNKKLILLDDALRNVFQRDSFTMFSMNKFVKRHVRKPDDLPPGGWDQIPRDGVSSDEDIEMKAAKKKSVKRKKKSTIADDEADDSKPKKKNAFNTELSLSPELASLVGSDRMARPQIVKALWAYIHEHDLQDPNDKRTILLDDKMKQVFQRDSFTMFAMNKFLKRHARKPSDVPAGGWAEIPRDGLSSDEDENKKKVVNGK
ncbi:swib complex baf60b domain-containing protein [Plasmopara halstedii]|uniref:Swib complex baf60b domain-containing protein n=1 Tax=Plasmopara halstedii TaxID=4781 RepID=A0A0P1AQQ6_PLAHL|nr:swib complex baf60b domain-containing protein [Plasmopara halstedii]CEG43671.1 swib complex baf60b domain-containing protein [Plasmopara halstedii]|eukprot:XP_024580040.1 swib complex baf60b domain-containing protein [Plasmopara halstedii]